MPRSVVRSAKAKAALWVATVLLLAGCSDAPGSVRITLAHGLDPSHPVHRAMVEMGRVLDEESGGTMALAIYPSEQLGSERECLELLQIGSLDMTKVSAAVLENFAPAYRVLSAPYVFRDDAHRVAALDGDVGREILRSSEPRRLRGLGFYDAGSRSFYTRDRAIREPADLVGLKIRTQESASAMALVRALGGAAAPIAWGELYTALQQGVVDGAENNPPSFHLARHFEVARFLSLDEHTSVPDVLLVGTPLWGRLDARQRQWLETAVGASVAVQRRLWRAATEAALAHVAAGGVEIIRPDKAAFARATEELRASMRKDPETGLLLKRIEAMGS